jgi:transposase InsO family protein
MEQRREFVRLAMQVEANRRELCRRFGIHPETAYKWLGRFANGDGELADRSRRPHTSPGRSDAAMEAKVLSVRADHPAWGARKIAHCLARAGTHPPAHSTVHAILQRHGLIVRPPGAPEGPYQRFEKEAPNLLWQMDFKGWVRLADGVPCHPLTIVDDHSRFAPCLAACANEQSGTVQGHLETTFRHYGLPDVFFVDNGSPWGDASGQHWTRLGVWLLKLGIRLLHSRPYHPQSRGKNERFHRTLAAEVFALRRLRDLAEAQRVFDQWREIYNRTSEHPSGYVTEEKRLCWPGCDPAGYFGFCRARSVMDWAANVVRAVRAKIQGPSVKGWIASISPASAASRSVLGAILRSFAALPRLSQGSMPSSAALNTGMR